MVGVGARQSGPELVGISVPGLFQSGRAGCARLSLLIQSHRQRRQGVSILSTSLVEAGLSCGAGVNQLGMIFLSLLL